MISEEILKKLIAIFNHLETSVKNVTDYSFNIGRASTSNALQLLNELLPEDLKPVEIKYIQSCKIDLEKAIHCANDKKYMNAEPTKPIIITLHAIERFLNAILGIDFRLLGSS